MWYALFALGVVALLSLPQAPDSRASGTISVDASRPGHAIPANLYGIFFEEISHAGDGGLYAELIQNRGFEDARLPPMCQLEAGFVVPPRTPHFDTGRPSEWRLRWNVTSDTPAWTLDAGGGTAEMRLTDAAPLADATPHSLLVDVNALPSGGSIAVRNEGFWGINVKEGSQYTLSLYARSDGSFTGGSRPASKRRTAACSPALPSRRVSRRAGRNSTRRSPRQAATRRPPSRSTSDRPARLASTSSPSFPQKPGATGRTGFGPILPRSSRI